MGRKLIKHPVSTGIYLLFILLIVVPVVYTVGSAFISDGSLGKNIRLLDKETFLLLGKSILIALIIALLSTLSGTVLGFSLYKTRVKFQGFFKVALLIPLFVSPYIPAVAWKDLFFTVFHTTNFISSNTGVIFVLTTVFTPLSMLITGSAFAAIDTRLEESGLMITKFGNVIVKIVLPLIKPAVLSSFILVFIFSISEFSVPAFFGVRVFTTEIFTQFSAFYNHSLAILQSALLILVCVILLLSEKKYIADAPFLSVSSKGTSSKRYGKPVINKLSFLFLSVWLFISVILPLIVLLMQSFKDGTASIVKAFELLLPTFGSSAGLAFAGAVLIVIVGFAAAYNSTIKNKKETIKSFDPLLLIVFAIPSTILGISLIKFYNHPGVDFIYSSFAIILIGYVGKFSFISAKLVENAIKQIPFSLFEAAQIEGISSSVGLRKILFPLIAPALFAAFIIAFIFSMSELGTTIMVYPPGSDILPIKVYTIMANAPQSLTSSMTLIVFLLTLLFISGFYFIAKPVVKNYGYAND